MSTPTSIHGTFIAINRVGVLLLGPPGCGKSELALNLITAGHQLIADDLVEYTSANNQLVGRSPDLSHGYLHLRQIGMLDISKMFGSLAVSHQHQIDLIIDFGTTILSTQLSALAKIDLNERKSLPTVAVMETIVRNFILQQAGHDANKLFSELQQQAIRQNKS